jgi:hypothetical protein
MRLKFSASNCRRIANPAERVANPAERVFSVAEMIKSSNEDSDEAKVENKADGNK